MNEEFMQLMDKANARKCCEEWVNFQKVSRPEHIQVEIKTAE